LGHLYELVKIGKNPLKSSNYWFGAKVWLRENDEKIEKVGLLRKGQIACIKDDVLFPHIAFDDSFKFLEDNKPQTLIAKACRGKAVNYSKTFGTVTT
jgi:hypothetical protein